MKRAYIDSSVWIVYAEGLLAYQTQVDEELQKLLYNGWRFCISEAVLLEVLAN